jgi:hypothetical protein
MGNPDRFVRGGLGRTAPSVPKTFWSMGRTQGSAALHSELTEWTRLTLRRWWSVVPGIDGVRDGPGTPPRLARYTVRATVIEAYCHESTK